MGGQGGTEHRFDKQTKALREMEASWKRKSNQNEDLRASILQLKDEIDKAQARQDRLDKEAQRAREKAEKKVRDQTELVH